MAIRKISKKEAKKLNQAKGLGQTRENVTDTSSSTPAPKIKNKTTNSTSNAVNADTSSRASPPIRRNRSSIANPSFHFYKDKAYGKGIESFCFDGNMNDIFSIDGAKSFDLTTTYPGLLVGSGYSHPKLKENNDDFQLGFFFDHTTGLPIISGSSIKGVMRSIFPQSKDRLFNEKKEYLMDVYDIKNIDDKINKLFDNNATVIFYDAYIVESKNNNREIFADDYITSHQDGIFSEPNPVKFLKVLPDVTFRFQFKASDEQIDFFRQVLLDRGVGAKTNVGYGQFVE